MDTFRAYELMLTIRYFEEAIERLFLEGRIMGTAHTCIGQEAVAVGVAAALEPRDAMTTTHRGHGHFLARGADAGRMMAEFFGRETGYSRGRGGSQMMMDPSIGFYGATPNYAFQFDDLGHVGLRDQLRDCLKSGDSVRTEALITDEILDQFAIVARWDDLADRMIERYKGIASRLVIYLASHWREVDPKVLARWGEIARAVRQAG